MEDVFLIILLFIVILFFKYLKYKQYRLKKPAGDYGEQLVINKLTQLGSEFIIQNNVYYGKAQIDHIVFNHSKRIIFVIETKFWSGVITGECNDKKWKQEKNGNINYYDNPILQNKYHCNQVKKYYPNYNVYNIVVFINNNAPKYKCIIGINSLVDYIYDVSNKNSNNIPIAIQTDRKS